MLGPDLGQVQGIAHVILHLIRKCPEILVAGANPVNGFGIVFCHPVICRNHHKLSNPPSGFQSSNTDSRTSMAALRRRGPPKSRQTPSRTELDHTAAAADAGGGTR